MCYHGIDNLEMMALARNYNAFLVSQLVRYCQNAKTVLDFGAGSGTFTDALHKRGIAVQCVECDPTLFARLRYRGYAVYRDIDEVPPQSFDRIFALNVLEHIEYDRTVIQRLFERLSPGGCLYAFVPAFDFLFSSMDRKVGHYRRYTRGQLVARLRTAGFVVDRAEYVDSLGLLATLAYKLVGNRRGDLNRTALLLYDRVVFPMSRIVDITWGGLVGKNLAVLARRDTNVPYFPDLQL